MTDTTPPSIPENLVVSAKRETSFLLSWDAATDDTAVTGYKIYKDGVLFGTSATTSKSVTGLAASTDYSMTVTAYDAADNESDPSDALIVKTPPQGPADITSYGVIETSNVKSFNGVVPENIKNFNSLT